MQGARARPWWLPRASRATPQTPLSLPTLRDRADFPSCGVVASLLGIDPTASAPPCLRENLPRSRPRKILRQAPWCENAPAGSVSAITQDRLLGLQVVERSAMVTFTAKQMFDLVNDVGRYPEFLPWCTGARVEYRSDTERVASVKVARGFLRMEFTTRNTL